MRRGYVLARVGWVLVAGVLTTACGDKRTAATAGPREAWAELKDAQGRSVGSATFRAEGQAMRIMVQAEGLAPGPHGIHVHAVGRCQGPTFTSAGDHLNPLGKKHGLSNPEGAHAGDLPNLEADAGGRARYAALTDRLTLGSGPTSLFDADGSALVIHAKPDDQRTDPAGDSGDRVVCGEIVRRTG